MPNTFAPCIASMLHEKLFPECPNYAPLKNDIFGAVPLSIYSNLSVLKYVILQYIVPPSSNHSRYDAVLSSNRLRVFTQNALQFFEAVPTALIDRRYSLGLGVAMTEKMEHQQMETGEGQKKLSYSRETNWLKVLFQIQVTLSALCAIHFLLHESYWSTIIFTFVLVFLGHIGVAAGAHRLWAHRSYSANGILKTFLLFCQTLSGTGSVYDWVQWHRLHHKHFGTDLDPFNPTKGWFYSHIQSVALNLSPAQEEALKEVDMSDLEKDKMIMFQKRWYIPLYVIFVLLLPINAPAEYWGEQLHASMFLVFWLRYTLNLHLSWLIHSATRIWQLKPGEKYPADTNLVFIITKTNWLAYHYMAPWDYQTSEFGQYGTDVITKVIRVLAALELASDLRTIDSDSVRKALTMSLKQKRNVTDCLWELTQDNNNIPKDHYLTPSKYM